MKNKLTIIFIILVIILLCILLIIFNQKGNVDMEEKKVVNTDTSFDFNNKYVLLNNGIKMPIIGLGTWTFSNEEAEEAVYFAIKNGYRLIDTAQYYGDEVGVGKGVRKAINEGIVKY